MRLLEFSSPSCQFIGLRLDLGVPSRGGGAIFHLPLEPGPRPPDPVQREGNVDHGNAEEESDVAANLGNHGQPGEVEDAPPHHDPYTKIHTQEAYPGLLSRHFE